MARALTGAVRLAASKVHSHTTTSGTETRVYFPVTLRHFVGDEAAKAQEYHAVVRDDTGDVLGIHRGTVPNREVFEPFEEVIVQSGDPARWPRGSWVISLNLPKPTAPLQRGGVFVAEPRSTQAVDGEDNELLHTFRLALDDFCLLL